MLIQSANDVTMIWVQESNDVIDPNAFIAFIQNANLGYGPVIHEARHLNVCNNMTGCRWMPNTDSGDLQACLAFLNFESKLCLTKFSR
jgi:hypothetical protein